MHLRWTEAAADDLERIADYLFSHAPDRASRLVRSIYLRFAERRAAPAGIVQALLVTRHMLLVGFSLTDDNFHRIVHDVRQALPSDQAARRAFGTALMLEHNPLLGELWRPEIEVLPMAAEGQLDEPAVAPRLEVFLDAVGMLAADGTAHLLDASLDGAFGEAERVLREELTQFQRRLPDQVWSTAAGRRLARLLQEFGAPAPPIAAGDGSVRGAVPPRSHGPNRCYGHVFRRNARNPSPVVEGRGPVVARRHFALVSGCISPRMFPSGSFTYASHPTPGMAIFGRAGAPPSSMARPMDSSSASISTVHTNALTLCPSTGAGPRRGTIPPLMPGCSAGAGVHRPVRHLAPA